MSIRKKLYEDMAADARERRIAKYRAKFASPKQAEVYADADEAIENSHMPEIPKGKGMALKVDSMEDVNNDDFQKAMADMEEDEEMQKWMAKQKG